MTAALAMLASLALVGFPGAASFDAAQLAALAQTSASATFHGRQTICTGPRLADVLGAAGAPQGAALRGPALAQGVIAEGADGYRVLFALGELDPLLGNAPVIVALACDGKPIAAEAGPLRLLAGGDRRGARAVRQLVTLRLLPPAKDADADVRP